MSLVMRVLILFFCMLWLPARAAEPLPVVASFSILGDLTARVGGERIALSTLVGPNADAHMYRPSPQDARRLAAARLVVVNGLGFEGWIDRLIRASGASAKVVVASQGVSVIRAAPAHHAGHAHTDDTDPHAWLDPANARQYITNITQALTQADPAGAAYYRARAQTLLDALDALDADIKKTLSALPAARKVVVSSHDSFAYFGRAYGITFRAAAGLRSEAGASAADVARLIRQIKRDNIPAVFLENISDPRLIERIRAETGARIGGTLYSDALSESNGPAASYLDLMRHNARVLAAALAP